MRLRLALVQFNACMGALDANVVKMAETLQWARSAQADLVIFPELSLCGYPPEDLLLTNHFLTDVQAALETLASHTRDICAVVGYPQRRQGRVHNAAAVIDQTAIRGVYHKRELPNYGVFDEQRYFTPGECPLFLNFCGLRLALSICEDVWVKDGAMERWVREYGCDAVINIAASPFYAGKLATREEILSGFARRTQASIAYCNLVGGQDELVFDGGNMFFNSRGELEASAPRFREERLLVEMDAEPKHSGPSQPAPFEISVSGKVRENRKPAASPQAPCLSRLEEIHEALILGLRDYAEKNGFGQVVMGLSGGIDSALTAALAIEALGPDRCLALTMPSAYTSAGTLQDAHRLASQLGMRLIVIPIEPLMASYRETLAGKFEPGPEGIEFENLQARIRGNLLMAFSNRYGWLVLTTGNKSEIATGYCTLYGDMAGGFAVIKDVPKTLVYELAAHQNRKAGRELIPASILQRPPTAELRPNQKDEDSLPPYAVLDPILEAYIEADKSPDEIVAMGFSPEVVREIIQRVDRSEYKRRQAPPGIKITPKAFGRDRRLPVTNRYGPRFTAP